MYCESKRRKAERSGLGERFNAGHVTRRPHAESKRAGKKFDGRKSRARNQTDSKFKQRDVDREIHEARRENKIELNWQNYTWKITR